MRDVLCVPLDEQHELVFATDCSGGIGLKQHDVVHVPYDVVGYYGARVALMELLSIGATPNAFILQNFVDDRSWEALVTGVQQTMIELQLSLPVTGSSESNMTLMQSAVGFVAVGMVRKANKRVSITPTDACWAVIGEPLVGEAVIHKKDRIIPLSLFRMLLQVDGVYEMIPIGSKGIWHEWKLVHGDIPIHCPLPLHASAGPATCVLVSYHRKQEPLLQSLAQTLFYPIVNEL
ncbi:ATPase [Anoxybacillus sp. TBDG-1]